MPDGFIPQGDEFRVNTETAIERYNSSLTALADGGYVVTWASDDGQDGSGRGLYAQRYDADGATVGAEFQVNTENVYDPSITALVDGGFVVTWAAGGGIYGQRYDVDSVIVGDEFQVSTETLDSQQYPTITALDDSGFVVIWASLQGPSSDIKGQRYDANGEAVGVEFQVNTETTILQLYPSITALAGGGFVVTWTSINGSDYGIYGQRYDADGAAVGGEFQVNTETANDRLYPSITALADGGFVVTWQSEGQDGDGSGIYGQRYGADGTTDGDEFQVNTETSGGQWNPSITALADGGLVVTWVSDDQDGDGWGIYGQRYGADGATVGDEFQVNTETSGGQWGPSVTALAGGGFVVSWGSDGQVDEQNDFFQTDFFAQQFAAQTFGTANDNEISDTIGSNWINGRDGNDILNGLQGDDILFGGMGNDELNGGEDDDTLNGGEGDDVLVGGDGYDLLNGGAGKDTLSGGNDRDILKGGKGKDTLDGGDDYDVLRGGKGKDTLLGGKGGDTLNGGKGADVLNGGTGKDDLYGGKGKDVFVFAAGDGSDTIFDFKNGKDKLDLSAFDFANKAEAKSHFFEKGSVSNDVVGFKFDGTKIRIEGLDLGDINGADFII